MKREFILSLFFLQTSICFGQSFSMASFTHINTTFIGLTSKKEINNNFFLKPWVGFDFGIMSRFSIKKKTSLDINFLFQEKRNLGNPLTFRDAVGQEIGSVKNISIANYFSVGAIYNYLLPSKIYIGGGLNFNILINAKSKIRIPEDPFGNPFSFHGLPLDKKYKNHNIRPLNIEIPIVLGYQFKRFLFSLVFQKGILSRVKNSEIKERENTLSLGLGYVLIKDKSLKPKK